VAAITRRLAGIDRRRPLPELARHPATPARLRALAAAASITSGPQRGRVVLWADTFTRTFSPGVAESAAVVLAEAGFEVTVPDRPSCCGLTWISTGQLGGARARLRATVARLAGYAEQGMTIVGLEPSCTAVLRGDLTELLGDDPRARAVAAATRTLAETLLGAGAGGAGAGGAGAGGAGAGAGTGDAGWLRGRLAGTRVIAQPHCHQHAVMGYEADLAVLRAAGAEVDALAGCCGLAGNFGMEQGHYEVSVAVAEHTLLPALRAAPEPAVLLADGFSCRIQAAQLAGRPALHLAQLLDPRASVVGG
jgi:Fe-S oxidoreductase